MSMVRVCRAVPSTWLHFPVSSACRIARSLHARVRAQDCVSEVFFLAPALPAHRSAGQIVIRPPSSAMAGRSRSRPRSRAPSRRAEPIPVHQRTETQITRLRGKSGTSRVNVSIQRGRLSSQGLAGFRAAFASCAVPAPRTNSPKFRQLVIASSAE